MRRDDLAFADPITSCGDCRHRQPAAEGDIYPMCHAQPLPLPAHLLRQRGGSCGPQAALFAPGRPRPNPRIGDVVLVECGSRTGQIGVVRAIKRSGGDLLARIRNGRAHVEFRDGWAEWVDYRNFAPLTAGETK